MFNCKWNLLIVGRDYEVSATTKMPRKTGAANTKNKKQEAKKKQEARTKKQKTRAKKLCRKTFTNIITKIALDHFLCRFYHVHKSLVVADTMTNYYWLGNANHRCAAIIFIMKAVKIFIVIYITANGHIVYRLRHF